MTSFFPPKPDGVVCVLFFLIVKIINTSHASGVVALALKRSIITPDLKLLSSDPVISANY